MTTAYLPFPDFNQVILPLWGPFALRWYSLAYIMGIVLGWIYTRHILRTHPQKGLKVGHLDDVVSYLIVGVVLGGRLGYVLFYKPFYYLQNPLEALQVWQGGMSFHGGLIGSALAFAFYAWRWRVPFFALTDVASMAAPIGLFFGRIANFINGELYGRVGDVPWAMMFPSGGYLPRHPSQLYEALLEGFVLFFVLWWCGVRHHKLDARGFLSGLFILGYGVARFVVEFYREADAFLGYFLSHFTLGQFLSIPLMIYGGYLMWRASCDQADS